MMFFFIFLKQNVLWAQNQPQTQPISSPPAQSKPNQRSNPPSQPPGRPAEKNLSENFVSVTYTNAWIKVVNPKTMKELSSEIKKTIPEGVMILVVEPQDKKTRPFSGFYMEETLKKYGFTTTRTFYSEVTLPPLQKVKEVKVI